MKLRTTIAGAAAAAALALPGLAGAQSPAGDSVTGEARDCAPIGIPEECLFGHGLTIDAHSAPNGEQPAGSLSFFVAGDSAAGFNRVEAEVTCLSVAGRVAVAGFTGIYRNDFYGITQPQVGFVRVVDGGGPATGRDVFETVVVRAGDLGGPLLPGPTDCSSFPPASERSVNDRGDLVVTDVRPTPTAMDECKRGGWRDFGAMFQNQGQCVAFVQRGPKPPRPA